jgi:hypothetical protein
MKKFFCLFIVLTLLTVPCLIQADLHDRHDSAEAKAYIGRTDLAELFTRKNEDYPFELVLPDWVRSSLTEMEIYEEIYKKVGIDLKEEVKLGRLSVKDGKYYINFREKKIEKEVIRRQKRHYGFNLSRVSLEDACKVDGLNLSGQNIIEPVGLEYLINIQMINLSRNKRINNYLFLNRLTRLGFLDLDSNNISSPLLLSDLNKDITVISLQDNNISDISFLTKFTHLRLLFLSNNQITSLKGFENLNELEELFIDGNPITLDGLRYIEQLCFSEVLWKLHIDRKAFGEYGKHFALYPEYLQWIDRIYFYEDDGSVTEWRNE